MNAHQLASYKNATYTLQKTRQIVLLYDAAIRFTKQAKQAIDEKDYSTRFELLQKVSNILAGLYNSLDYENGGEISRILSSFYTGLDLKVISINRTNSLEDCDYVISELKNMRDSWDKIDQQYASSQNATQEQMHSPINGASNESAETESANFTA